MLDSFHGAHQALHIKQVGMKRGIMKRKAKMSIGTGGHEGR